LKKPKKKVSRRLLVKKLDAAFSKFIRWRAADADGNVKCVTCDTVAPVKSMQNGHFMSRRHYSLRWHAYGNCSRQCYGCNIGSQGNQFKHGQYIDKKYGEGTAQRLLERSTELVKYGNEELIQLTKHYNTKVDEYTNKHS
jgi:hypothetical protein